MKGIPQTHSAVAAASLMKRVDRCRAGFSLVELLLAMALGTLLSGVAVQLLLGDARAGGTLTRRFQLRGWQRRTLALVKYDLARASSWEIRPDPSRGWPCALADRQAQLAITPRDGSAAVVYSIGAAPSPIWRGPVLMRCGPAFTLDGRPSAGAYQNRVVLDGVERFAVDDHPELPVLLLQLEQRSGYQLIRSSAVG